MPTKNHRLPKKYLPIRKSTTRSAKGVVTVSRIDIGEIQTFAYQLHTANEAGRKSIKDIKNAVKNYTEDGSLKGKAIDASKNYYQMTYFPLCDAIIEAMNESEERLAQYIADFHAQVDGSADARIDADGLYELGKMIDRIEAKKEALAQRMNTGTEGQMQSYRSQLSIAYKQENILEKYLAFEQSHGGFFDNLTDLVRGIQQTIRELQSNIQFNSKTGTYDMSKLNFTTVTRMQNASGKALNDNAKTFNFDEYQKTYRGQMWVLMKNGIVDVEATNAYNTAVLNGELPHDGNAPEQDAEQLKAVLESLKNKKDPITGVDISSIHVISILSGLAFTYTAGRYRGKKISISNHDLWEIRNKNGTQKVIYSANGKPYLRALRRTQFDEVLKNGFPNGTKFNQHAYNSLFKSGRKDIMPDDIIEALSNKPVPSEPGSVKYVNEKTGTSVFVNPETNTVVGIWPQKFKQ
ncbi:transposase [Listeria monocytogenes]|nr:transposase [Listeria monocytogenes]ECC1357936.1 transposase [Listeria monocytogenes]ECC1591031.1 transposase [Listeria monocytogenes]ECC1688508.1 transposase [Listeria monocytogenes]ECC2256717.1 transposase [Listeria monocytogenes]